MVLKGEGSKSANGSIPRDPITERQRMTIGVYNHLRNARYLKVP